MNPFGVQMDGTIVENGHGRRAAVGRRRSSGRAAPDLSQDFVFTSKGRLTEYGYEVEMRIPFKSLKYQSADEQSWDLNVVRQVQHSGYEDSWAPAKRSNASFLAQSGTIDGLDGLRSRARARPQSGRDAQGDRRAERRRAGDTRSRGRSSAATCDGA